jgi:hypothetical protein
MSSQAEQDNYLIADCDGALQANHEFNSRCEEDWDDKSIRDVGDVRYSFLERIMSARATGLAALRAKAAVCGAMIISCGVESSGDITDTLVRSLLADLGAIFPS